MTCSGPKTGCGLGLVWVFTTKDEAGRLVSIVEAEAETWLRERLASGA